MIIAAEGHAAMTVLVVTSAAVVLALPSLAVSLIRGRLVAGIRIVSVLGVLTVIGLVAATVLGATAPAYG